jgi:hypothetical protein
VDRSDKYTYDFRHLKDKNMLALKRPNQISVIVDIIQNFATNEKNQKYNIKNKKPSPSYYSAISIVEVHFFTPICIGKAISDYTVMRCVLKEGTVAI